MLLYIFWQSASTKNNVQVLKEQASFYDIIVFCFMEPSCAKRGTLNDAFVLVDFVGLELSVFRRRSCETLYNRIT